MRSYQTAGTERSADEATNLSPYIARSIREINVFRGLGDKELHRLAALSNLQDFEPGTTIFYEGDPAQFLFGVTEGLVKVFKQLADGRCQTTGFFHPRDLLGLAYHDRYVYTAEAVTAAQLCRFGRPDL